LFFPACGTASFGSVDSVGYYGSYWSSSLYADYGDSYAYLLSFNKGDVTLDNNSYRYYGFPVRGVVG
jgi:hypothetical protein